MADLAELRRRVQEDAALRAALAALPEPGFAAAAAALAAARGLALTEEEVRAALTGGRAATPRAAPGEARRLEGYVPAEVDWQDGVLVVDWCYLGARRLLEPFYADTLQAVRSTSLTRLLRVRTPIAALGERHAASPGLPLAGIVLHASRCGSTLVAQQLAALPPLVVVSEPAPLDAVLRARLADPALPEAAQVDWLRWLVSALGQPRGGGEARLVLKLDAWNVVALELLERAFPDVPWVFVYREPAEIIVSQLRRRGLHMVPGLLEPELFGLEPAAVATMPAEEYCARVIGRLCAAAADGYRPGRARLVAYAELPGAVAAIAAHFGLALGAADRARMSEVARRDAKEPAHPFADDRDDKRRAVTPAIRDAAAAWAEPAVARLEAMRQRQTAA